MLYNSTIMIQEQLTRFQKLFKAIKELNNSGDSDSYLQSILSHAVDLTETETASILAYNPATRDLRFVVVPWFHRDALKGEKVPLEGSAAGKVIRENKPLILSDTRHNKSHFDESDRLSNFQTQSLVAVPIILHGQTVGVLEVLNKNNNADYTEDDVTILEMLASLAALAMQNRTAENPSTDSADRAELDRLKSDFIAITSHELRTPLGLIIGHSTFLREIVTSEFHEQLDTIIRNASRLKEIIESLSNVDNIQAGAARIRQGEFSIQSIIEDVASSFAGLANEKNVSFKLQLPASDLRIEADQAKINVALSNIIKNAVMFSNPGGEIDINAKSIPGFVEVSIADYGLGIPEKDLPYVFDRFYQVEGHLTRKHGGMGLGLSVAKSMIEIHGGTISVASIEGKGSKFTFTLPTQVKQPVSPQSAFLPEE